MTKPTLPPLAAFSKAIAQVPDRLYRNISPNDDMFAGNPVHYLYVGHSALRAIYLALLAAGKTEPKAILDLPCGYGRVMRWLKIAFPNAALTACDLNADAVDFCARQLSAQAVPSSRQPDEVTLPSQYDLIWCGSLLTHLDKADWAGWLALYETALVPGGVLVFSTHGMRVAELLRKGNPYLLGTEAISRLLQEYEATGFGFQEYADSAGYGVSIATPSRVCDYLAQFSKLQIVHLHERGWAQHQDVFACVKRELPLQKDPE